MGTARLLGAKAPAPASGSQNSSEPRALGASWKPHCPHILALQFAGENGPTTGHSQRWPRQHWLQRAHLCPGVLGARMPPGLRSTQGSVIPGMLLIRSLRSEASNPFPTAPWPAWGPQP